MMIENMKPMLFVVRSVIRRHENRHCCTDREMKAFSAPRMLFSANSTSLQYRYDRYDCHDCHVRTTWYINMRACSVPGYVVLSCDFFLLIPFVVIALLSPSPSRIVTQMRGHQAGAPSPLFPRRHVPWFQPSYHWRDIYRVLGKHYTEFCIPIHVAIVALFQNIFY